jgi:hypothetical protein
MTGAADAELEARHLVPFMDEFDVEVAQVELIRRLGDKGLLGGVPELDDQAVLFQLVLLNAKRDPLLVAIFYSLSILISIISFY